MTRPFIFMTRRFITGFPTLRIAGGLSRRRERQRTQMSLRFPFAKAARIAAAGLLVLLLRPPCPAQALNLQFGQSSARFELSGKILTGHVHITNTPQTEEFDFSANISDLALDSALSDTSTLPVNFLLQCKDGAQCVHTSSHTCETTDASFPCDHVVPSYDSDTTYGDVWCSDDAALEQCKSFLGVLRVAANTAE